MFNDKRIERLEARIEALENLVEQQVRKLRSEQFITEKTTPNDNILNGFYGRLPRQIPLVDAVQALADHLGLYFKIEEGTPERLTLQKPAKGK